MVSQASCYSTSTDGRRYNRPYPPYLGYHQERRFHPVQPPPPPSGGGTGTHHDISSRPPPVSVAMSEQQQAELDSPQQRKRIAVACGRCRKRKIRCSGDMGQGQPCLNCKNAGADQCLFLRVASREAPFLNEPSDFNYSVGDARVLATRAPVASGPILPYGGQDLTGAGGGGAGDVLATPYRSSAYPYAVASAPTKTYYPAPSQYSPQYGDEFDYGLGVTAQPVLSSDTVAMLPSQWSSSSRTTKSSSACGTAMYMDAAAAAAAASSYGGYGGPSLVHRPAPQVSVGSESTSLSLSGFGAELPSTSPADRVLPNPTSRTPLPYPGGGGGGGSSGMKSPIQSAVTGTGGTSTLADVAAAASYVGGYDNNGLSAAYTSVASSSSSLSGHHHHHHHHHLPNSSRAGSDTPYGPGESLFGEQERGLQHPGSAFDMSAYTAGSRRDSLSSAGHSGSSSSGQTASCVPTEPLHASSPVVAGYVGDHHPSPTSPHSHHRHSLSLSLSHRGLVTGGSNNNSTTASSSSSTIIGGGGGAIGATSHADNHRVAVATRR